MLGGNDWFNESQIVLSFCPESVLSLHTCRSRCRQVIKGNLIGFVWDQGTVWIGKTENNVWKNRSNWRHPLGRVTTDVLKIHECFSINVLLFMFICYIRNCAGRATMSQLLLTESNLPRLGVSGKEDTGICGARLMFSLWVHERAQASYKLIHLNKGHTYAFHRTHTLRHTDRVVKSVVGGSLTLFFHQLLNLVDNKFNRSWEEELLTIGA